MGRHAKSVVSQCGIDRRESGYYSTPREVAEFFAKLLPTLKPAATSCFDPCIGRGELVEPLLRVGLEVSGTDILPMPVPPGVHFRQADFLDFYDELKSSCFFGSSFTLDYDIYVANPPYNCHEVDYIRTNKRKLANCFGGIGVHNMYSMFISALVDIAKPGAVIGLITLDSFLTSRAHEELRRQILRECSIHYLVLCPNDLFHSQDADVRTCIMVLQKGKDFQGDVKVLNRPLNSRDFFSKLESDAFASMSLSDIVLNSDEDRDEFVVGVSRELRRLFAMPRLGNIFECVTGISTGDDSKYLSSTKKPGFTVPFYKNPGSTRFYTQPNAFLVDEFLELDKRIPNFMVRNKHLLFKAGITCSSMGVPFGACYLPENSTYGVNSNIVAREEDIWWLLSYLNSSLVTYLVRGVLLRTNMITSGYVARIPVPSFDSTVKSRLSSVAQAAYRERGDDSSKYGRIIGEIDDAVSRALGLTPETVSMTKEFAANILTAT